MRADEPTVRFSARPEMEWGSDALAALLSELHLPFISLVPGSSYRGLHDSIVNYLGNDPPIILCLHEEHAVALAHGYAKVTEEPMAVALHSNVGLMHATMALFNAFCDRVPMLVLGATGPVDAAERRPWIDWIHTTADLGEMVREYTKWDDQPISLVGALEAIARADQLTRAYPSAPTYVCLDSGLQEAPLEAPAILPEPGRHDPADPPDPVHSVVENVGDLLDHAKRPLILVGRVGRGDDAWAARIRLAEMLNARVLTDLKVGAGFPTPHPLNPAPPGTFLTTEGRDLLGRADVVLSLDWVDLAGTLQQVFGTGRVPAQIVSCTMDSSLHNGWSKDHFGLAPVDFPVFAHPDSLVGALVARSERGPHVVSSDWPDVDSVGRAPQSPSGSRGGISMSELAAALRRALGSRSSCLVRLPLGWSGSDMRLAHPLDYLGQDGGAGVGSGPGMAVGAALALQATDRLAIAVLGDGDFLMGSSALWTAAHHQLPLLVIVANNRSFFNDEMHQEQVALMRGRPVENRWVGQRIRDPDPDLATLATSLGLVGHGPVTYPAGLGEVLEMAVNEAAAGAAVVVDVHVTSQGYPNADNKADHEFPTGAGTPMGA